MGTYAVIQSKFRAIQAPIFIALWIAGALRRHRGGDHARKLTALLSHYLYGSIVRDLLLRSPNDVNNCE